MHLVPCVVDRAGWRQRWSTLAPIDDRFVTVLPVDYRHRCALISDCRGQQTPTDRLDLLAADDGDKLLLFLLGDVFYAVHNVVFYSLPKIGTVNVDSFVHQLDWEKL